MVRSAPIQSRCPHRQTQSLSRHAVSAVGQADTRAGRLKLAGGMEDGSDWRREDASPSSHMHSRCALFTPGRSPDLQSSTRGVDRWTRLPACAVAAIAASNDGRPLSLITVAGAVQEWWRTTHLLLVSFPCAQCAAKHLGSVQILRDICHPPENSTPVSAVADATQQITAFFRRSAACSLPQRTAQ